MAYRRTLNRIRLDKIAAVDKPCQQPAIVAIMKRQFTPEKRQQLADEGKAMPDGSYPIETVADLKNAVQSYGRANDKPAVQKHIVRRAKALNATEHLPDEWDAKKVLAKATFDEALQANMTADAVNCAFFDSFDGLWQRNDAFREALTDELASGGDGTQASTAYVDSVRQLVDDAVSDAREAGASTSDTSAIDKCLSAAVEKWLENRKEPTMKITTKAQLSAAISKFAVATSTVADVQDIHDAAKALDAEDLLPADGPLAKAKPDPEVASMKRELAILKLAPASKSYFDGLDEAGQTAFLAKSSADQQTEVEGATAKDPVVYKCADGTEIRKSDGAAVLSLAKRNDEQAAEIVKLKGDQLGLSFEKRATEEFPNVAKTIAVDMLKSAKQVGEDTEAGKGILKSLTHMNKGNSGFMKRMGSAEEPARGDNEGIAKARTDFNGKVEEIRKRDSIDTASAMSKARQENPDLFAEAYPDTVAAFEEATERAEASRAE